MISIVNEGVVKMVKDKAIPYRLHNADHKALKMFCVEKGVSMQELLEKAVSEYMKKWVV